MPAVAHCAETIARETSVAMKTVLEMSTKKENILLFIIVLLGLGLRLYRLPEQAIWFDEWTNYKALIENSNLYTFMSTFLLISPEQASAPAFYCCFYWSACLLGVAPTALRLFPVALGTCSIYLIYLLGCKISNRKAALVAALLLALSPQHIWYSQELRPYAFLVFVVLLSTLFLVNLNRSTSVRCYTAYIAVNVILVFTHIFAFIALAAQGIYLFLAHGLKYSLKWGAIHGLFVVAIVVVGLTMPHVSIPPTLGLPLPPIHVIILNTIARDVISICSVPSMMSANLPPLPEKMGALLLLRPFMDTLLVVYLSLLVLLYCVVVALAFYPVLKRFAYPEVASHARGSMQAANTRLLLLLILATPACVLALSQALLGLPFYNYGYDLYAAIGLYLLVGDLLSRCPPRLFRFLVLMFVVLYGYQCLIFLPGVTRPNWQGGAEYIKTHVADHDLILDEYMLAPISRREPYLKALSVPMHTVGSYAHALDKAARFFIDRSEDPAAHGDETVSVWLLSELVFARWGMPGKAPLQLLQEALAEYNLSGETSIFPGATDLAVVRIRPSETRPPRLPQPYSETLRTQDYDSILCDLGVVPVDGAEHERMIGALQLAIGIWPPAFSHAYYTQAAVLLMTGETELAAALADYVIQQLPSFGVGYFAMGMALAAQGKDRQAYPYFEQSYTCYAALERTFAPYVEALCLQNDYVKARAELERIARFPFPIYYDTAVHVLELRE